MNADPSQYVPDDDGMEEVPLDDRIAELMQLAYSLHGYRTASGDPDERPIIAKLVQMVAQARAHNRKDREKVVILRHTQMEQVWPKVPGPGQFDEQDDPEAAAGLYKQLSETLFRYCGPHANGVVQARLNGEHGLWLCRTNSTPDGSIGVYSTTDWGCLAADWSTPAKKRIRNAVVTMGTDADEMADRMPEHSKRLKRELTSGVRVALNEGVAPITARIEAQTEDGETAVEPDDVEGDVDE